ADLDGAVRWAAAEALGVLGATATQDVLHALLHTLTDQEEVVRWAAARALGALGATAATPEVLWALLQALTDSEEAMRQAAAEAVHKLTGYVRPPDRATVMQYLILLTRSRNMEQRDVGYVGLRNLLAATPA